MSVWRLEAMLRVAAVLGVLSLAGIAGAADWGVGRPATPQEIAGWDIDVRADGQGLPAGSGTAAAGEELYLERCSHCHGEFGEAFGRWPVLMGGLDSLDSANPVKTVGSYWPYATTVWDYINRAMPFGEAQSLTPDEVYALTAFLLNLSDVVAFDEELNQDNLAAIEMPNKGGFTWRDERPDVVIEEPCMKDCEVDTTVLGRAVIIDVTPDQEAVGIAVD